jgi:Flp pilus assembly pilin Flp
MEINMFTRFQRNVRLYPRTFTVLLVLAVIDAVVEVEVRHTPLVAGIAVAFVAGVIYAWFMSSAVRVSLLLQLLDNFEGRVPNEYGSDGTEVGESEESEEFDCGDEECSECHPNLYSDEEGQDVAEYAVMLAVMLAIVIGVIHMIGSNASNVFSQIGSKIQ